MDKSLLANFQKELSQLKEYINHIVEIHDLAEQNEIINPVFKKFTDNFRRIEKNKKNFEYKAIIISLYGLLEKNIQLWVQEYLIVISKLVSYEKLSRTVKNRINYLILFSKIMNFYNMIDIFF